MLVTKENASVTGDLTFAKEVEMQFDPSARNMQVRNAIRMYANPRLAALREYTSNARDAHKAAGYTGAVEVTLPNAMHPFLTIVDHGVGLDSKELEGFGQFGHTTKDGSNDYIGGFGLGSKSGLAVADQFTVISVKNGKKNVVVVGWDQTGAPKLGFLDEQVTDEHNGTTIQIPSNKGHDDWADIVRGNTFIGWEPGSILVNGKQPEKSVHHDEQYKKLNGGWLFREENSRYNPYNSTLHVLVHGVYYKVEGDKLRDRDIYRTLMGSVVEIHNGSVDILPSRDDLEWTEKTVNTVLEQARLLVQSIVAEYQESMNKAESFIEAKKIQEAMASIGLPTGGLSWKGIALDWRRTTEECVTSANVKASTTAASGWQNARDTHSVAGIDNAHRKHSILVVGGTGETKVGYYRKDQTYIVESRDAVPYIVAEANAQGIPANTVTVYFTNKKESDLPKGFVLSMAKVVSVTDYETQAKAQRKFWAENRVKTVKAGKTVNLDRQLRVIYGFSSYSSTMTTRERSENSIMSDATKVVVVHYEDALGKKIIDQHTDRSVSSSIRALMSAMTSSGTEYFIVLAKNHKAENLNIVGWESVSDWFKNTLKALPAKTPIEVSVQKFREENRYASVSNLDKSEISKINDPKVREWLTAYFARPSELHKLADLFPEFSKDIPEPDKFDLVEQYPLATKISVRVDEGQIFVDYFNMVNSLRTP